MNKVNLVARLVKDPEVRYTQGENATAIARFSVAVDRKFKRDGEPEADFPNIVAFGKTAEFIEKYFSKGMKIGIVGRLQTGKYQNKDGQTVYTTDVVAEEVEFVESKASHEGQTNATSRPEPSSAIGDGFLNIPDGIDEELPFC
jgi:single-strand DNA-binding protein